MNFKLFKEEEYEEEEENSNMIKNKFSQNKKSISKKSLSKTPKKEEAYREIRIAIVNFLNTFEIENTL